MNPKFAVAVIVLRQVDDTWQVLQVARKDDHTRWSLPGGKVDPGEDSPMAAVRELREETGIDVRPRRDGPGSTLVYSTRRLIPQGTVLDSDGYFTTFYLLDTTNCTLPETFEVAEHEAPVEWGPIDRLFQGPFGAENRARFKSLGLV